MIPLYFRAYYEGNDARGNDQPHGILKIVSRGNLWFQSPGDSESYQLNIGAKSWIEKQNVIAFNPTDHIRFVKISKAEYDMDVAFNLFPRYKVKYRPLWTTFEKRWWNVLLVIFFIHLAIVLFGIPMSGISVEESNRQVLLVAKAWLIFSSVSLYYWLLDSFLYWLKIRRGLSTSS